MKSFRIFAPATIGNVASGFDVLGLAVEGLGDYFTFTKADRYSISAQGRDALLIPLGAEQNAITIAAASFYAKLGQPELCFAVHLDRHLPLAGGLGSSAASSVAGALAAANFSQALDRQDLILEAALVAESQVAGAHLDNIAPCFYGGLTLVQDVQNLRVYPIPMAAKFWITLMIPDLRLETKESRRVLPQQLATAQWTRQMAHCSSLAVALARGDLKQLAFGLQDPFAEVARGSKIPEFFSAQKAALAAGAYGFSISGSGPSCFALSPDEATASEVGDVVRGVFGPKTQLHIAQPRLTGAVIL